MPRLYLFAEGQTELTFGDTVLSLHLAHLGVYLQGPILIAHARKKGRAHRGGGRNYLPMKNDIIRFLRQEQAGDVFFTTMIDLYAIHPDFPGLEAADGLRHDPYQRVRALEAKFAEDIGDHRFIPYIQLHEFEGLLFADPSGFELIYGNASSKIAALRAIADDFESPELIDDGQHTAPSKRILRRFPDYAKRVYGPQIAEYIGLDGIRRRCPHFNDWLVRLEQLGTPGE